MRWIDVIHHLRPRGGSTLGSTSPLTCPTMTDFHDLEMTSITGEQVAFDQYRGQLSLVVNVASR